MRYYQTYSLSLTKGGPHLILLNYTYEAVTEGFLFSENLDAFFFINNIKFRPIHTEDDDFEQVKDGS